MSEREHAADPVNAAFDQGCRRRRPRSSTAAASSVAPIARAPSSAPNRNITEKESGAAGDITIVPPAAAAPPRRPEQVEMRRARVFGDRPPRDKEHHLAGRKCWRESTPQKPPLSVLQIFRSVVDDPVARAGARQHHRSPRSPDLHRRPEPESANNNSAKTKMATSPAAAQPARAGRSARRSSVSQLAGIGARLARVRAANNVKWA